MNHIVHLTSVHYPFDPRIFHKQLRTLQEAGYRTTLIAHHNESVVQDGIEIISIGEVSSRKDRWMNLRRLYHIAYKIDADAYHLHDPELLPIGALLSLTTEAAIIYDVHEDYADAIRVREWIPTATKATLASTFPTIQSIVANRFDAIITADRSVQEQFQERGHNSVIALRNFPRIDGLKLSEKSIERSEDHILVYIGGLDRERGLMRMLRLTTYLRNQGLNIGLWLIGPFQDEAIEQRAKRFMKSAGIRDHVTLFGYIDYDDIFSYLNQADIGLLLVDQDRFERNVPTKLFEYLYAELPVVATEAESIKEYCDRSYTRLVPENDIKVQAEIISDLLREESIRQDMGKAGRDQVMANYCWENEQEKLLTLYKDVL